MTALEHFASGPLPAVDPGPTVAVVCVWIPDAEFPVRVVERREFRSLRDAHDWSKFREPMNLRRCKAGVAGTVFFSPELVPPDNEILVTFLESVQATMGTGQR